MYNKKVNMGNALYVFMMLFLYCFGHIVALGAVVIGLFLTAMAGWQGFIVLAIAMAIGIGSTVKDYKK